MSSSSVAIDAPIVDRARPRSVSDLFVSFTFLALQGFGGVLAVVQRELVEKKRWMTREEFVEDWAVAQILPGPNVVNLAIMFGERNFGWRGAAAGVLGLMLVPLLLVICLALVYTHYAANPHVAGALRGMGAIAAGLVTATGIKLATALRRHPLGVPMVVALAFASFASVGLAKLPLVYVLAVLGTLGCVLSYRKLAQRDA